MSLDILESPQVPEAGTGKQHTILVVDGDTVLAAGLSQGLNRQGFDALTAASGLEALELAGSRPLSLIVLESRLSDMDGLTFCRRLSATPLTCGIPVIVLSAMTRPDIIRRSHGSGVAYFVRKPCDAASLSALIRQAIRESGRVKG